MARGVWYIYIQTFFDKCDFVGKASTKDNAERIAKVLGDRIKSESGCVCLVRVQRISQRDATLHALDDQILRNLERGRRGEPAVEAFGAVVAADLLTQFNPGRQTRSESDIRKEVESEVRNRLKRRLEELQQAVDQQVQQLRAEHEHDSAQNELTSADIELRENYATIKEQIEKVSRERDEAKAKLKALEASKDCSDFRPASWFPKGMAARLRQAASKNRKGKRVATKTIDGVVCYCVDDAKRWWPDDVPTTA